MAKTTRLGGPSIELPSEALQLLRNRPLLGGAPSEEVGTNCAPSSEMHVMSIDETAQENQSTVNSVGNRSQNPETVSVADSAGGNRTRQARRRKPVSKPVDDDDLFDD